MGPVYSGTTRGPLDAMLTRAQVVAWAAGRKEPRMTANYVQGHEDSNFVDKFVCVAEATNGGGYIGTEQDPGRLCEIGSLDDPPLCGHGRRRGRETRSGACLDFIGRRINDCELINAHRRPCGGRGRERGWDEGIWPAVRPAT